jgi:hypothetical protein
MALRATLLAKVTLISQLRGEEAVRDATLGDHGRTPTALGSPQNQIRLVLQHAKFEGFLESSSSRDFSRALYRVFVASLGRNGCTPIHLVGQIPQRVALFALLLLHKPS